jgi:predicted Zn finger-like uncharacterized protein
MILTCPECATSYHVDDARVPSTGRRVRCSSCGHRWLAGPDGPIVEAASFAPEPEPLEAEPEAPVEGAVAEEPPLVVRPVVRPPPPSRAMGRSNVLVWAGAAALAVALVAGVIVFREQIVRFWPRSSAAYAGLGLQVGEGGLVLEQVHAEPAFLAGRPVLAVTGAIRNVRNVAVNAPPVRLTLLNRAGQPVAAKIARPMEASIPARAKRHFSVTMLDPPAAARDLEVRFETASAGKRAAHAATAVVTSAPPPLQPVPSAPTTAASEVAPATPAPIEAAPLSPAAASEHG